MLQNKNIVKFLEIMSSLKKKENKNAIRRIFISLLSSQRRVALKITIEF